MDYYKINCVQCLQAALTLYGSKRKAADGPSNILKNEMGFAARTGTQLYSERKR